MIRQFTVQSGAARAQVPTTAFYPYVSGGRAHLTDEYALANAGVVETGTGTGVGIDSEVAYEDGLRISVQTEVTARAYS